MIKTFDDKLWKHFSYFLLILILMSNIAYAAGTKIPDIYDDFSDGLYNHRTGNDTWGRSLPEWTIEQGKWSAANGYLEPTSLSMYGAKISTHTNITQGTWIFRYKYNGSYSNLGTGVAIDAYYLNAPTGDILRFENPFDGHFWLDTIKQPGNQRIVHNGYIVNMAGSQLSTSTKPYIDVAGTGWHEVTFVRENNYTRMWIDGVFVRWASDDVTTINNSTKFVFYFYDTNQYTPVHPIVIQSLQIYRDQYLCPDSTISYNSSLDAITINGIDTTLSMINSGVNNKSIFSYNATTNTAITNKNITLLPGSSLKIKDGKLSFNCASGKALKMNYYTDAGIYLENSTLDTTGQYYFIFNRMSDGESTLKNQFSVINSTINNFGGLYLERPTILNIQNSVISNMTGTTPMQAYFRWSPRQLMLRNSTFSGKTGKEQIILCGGDQFRKLLPKPVGIDIVDCNFSQTTLECIPDDPYYLSQLKPGCTANFINTKLNSFSGNISRQKYYLDVEVFDSKGDPVPGAEVTVKNDIDDFNYPTENLLQGSDYFQLSGQLSTAGNPYFGGQTANWIQGLTDVNDHRTAITGLNGHTPPPSDDLNTLVVTGSESNISKAINYTYIVTASKYGYTNTSYNVTPDSSWLRSNPENNQNTVLLKLNTPILNPVGNKKVTLDSLLEFEVTTSVQNKSMLSYSASGLPNGATFNNTSGVFTWVPATNQTGKYTVMFNVSDGYLTDTENVNISVYPRWDVNKDGVVNRQDIDIIGQRYGNTTKVPYPEWDINEDGMIDPKDLIITESHFN